MWTFQPHWDDDTCVLFLLWNSPPEPQWWSGILIICLKLYHDSCWCKHNVDIFRIFWNVQIGSQNPIITVPLSHLYLFLHLAFCDPSKAKEDEGGKFDLRPTNLSVTRQIVFRSFCDPWFFGCCNLHLCFIVSFWFQSCLISKKKFAAHTT